MVRYSSLYGVPQCHKTSNTNQKYAKKSNINSKTVFHNHIWHPTKDQMRTHLGSSSFEHYIPSMLIGGSFKSSIDLFNLFLYLFMHLPDVFSHHQSHRFLCSQPSIGIRSTTIRGFAPCTILNEFHVVIFFLSIIDNFCMMKCKTPLFFPITHQLPWIIFLYVYTGRGKKPFEAHMGSPVTIPTLWHSHPPLGIGSRLNLTLVQVFSPLDWSWKNKKTKSSSNNHINTTMRAFNLGLEWLYGPHFLHTSRSNINVDRFPLTPKWCRQAYY